MTDDMLESLEADPEPKRDRWGRPLIPDPDTGKETAYTRVTTFAKSISDTFGLAKWQTRMAIKGVALRPDLFALAAATPVEDSKTLDRVAEDAKQAAGASGGANQGSAIHSFTEPGDRGLDIVIPAPWDRDVAAYRAALVAGGYAIDRRYIERTVVIPALGCAGRFDRLLVRVVDGVLVVGDIKTGKSMDFGQLEIAVQLALYAHGKAIWNTRSLEYEPMPTVDQEVAIVMHTPVGKGISQLYRVDIAAGWQAAQVCASVRGWRARKGLLTPIAVPTNVTALIKEATSVGNLEVIWTRASAAGLWTDAHTTAAAARKRQLLSQ